MREAGITGILLGLLGGFAFVIAVFFFIAFIEYAGQPAKKTDIHKWNYEKLSKKMEKQGFIDIYTYHDLSSKELQKLRDKGFDCSKPKDKPPKGTIKFRCYGV